MSFFKKVKSTFKKVKYYVGATLCAGAIYGGLVMSGVITTWIPSAPDTIRCFVGDMGTGEEGERLVAEAMHKHKCQELFLLGDIIYENGLKDADDPNFEKKFWKYYKDFPALILTQGNHDSMGSTKGMEAWIELSRRHKNIIYPAHFFLYKSGTHCVFSFFSEPIERDDNMDFSLRQAVFAGGLDLSGCQIKIAISHHPYRSQGDHGDCMDNVCKFFDRHIIGKYDYAIAGHDHSQSYEGKFKGTEVYVSGAGSKLRTCKTGRDKTCWERLGFLKMVGINKPEFIFVENL